ncbi:type II toxin-antitoxin system Phd/YefM family antitoxin [Caldilinea sp.]|uniref:type II toxin-antitoxin system Phd/YefM family antitoxin n=1 Tax=Caldilinea sp. TaxID=2293560 RepID=UPI002614C3AE|nr:type II toxin-antitoxin system prevent-host-death family antitoxin [Caldilinea sp.]
MMPSIGAYEAKTHFSELLKRVQRGERFIITHHGAPVAVLAPLESAPERPVDEVIAALKAFRRKRSLDLPLKALIEEGRA